MLLGPPSQVGQDGGYPLWKEPRALHKERLCKDFPDASLMDFSPLYAYLGLAVGPDRSRHIWSKAKDKFSLRTNVWKESHQGLPYASTAYNIIVITVLSYIW